MDTLAELVEAPVDWMASVSDADLSGAAAELRRESDKTDATTDLLRAFEEQLTARRRAEAERLHAEAERRRVDAERRGFGRHPGSSSMGIRSELGSSGFREFSGGATALGVLSRVTVEADNHQ